jgi:hypothetical protein
MEGLEGVVAKMVVQVVANLVLEMVVKPVVQVVEKLVTQLVAFPNCPTVWLARAPRRRRLR